MGLEEVAAIMAVEEETATDMRRDTQERELVAAARPISILDL